MFLGVMLNCLLALSIIGFVCGDIKQLRNVDFNGHLETSGMTVVDVDGDGDFEVIVAVRDGPNLIIKYDHRTGRYRDIADTSDGIYDAIEYPEGHIVSTCACDIDGDGVEEIYLQNDISANGAASADRLLKRTAVYGYVDIFAQELNRKLTPTRGGRSVGCVDIHGSGKYSLLISTVRVDGQGVYILLAMDEHHPQTNISLGNIVLKDITEQAGLQEIRDGRGIVAGPIFGNSDVFIANGNSYYVNSNAFRHVANNCLFRNNGDGTFTNVASDAGVEDQDQNGRSAALEDINNDGLTDILLTSWLGYNEIFLQTPDGRFTSFRAHNPDSVYSAAAAADIMLVTDVDNNGRADVLINGADADRMFPVYNRIVSAVVGENYSINFELSEENTVSIKHLQITGLGSVDLNQDGIPELIVSHKQITNQGSTLSVFQSSSSRNNWLRVLPRTKYGSPARGAMVTLTLSDKTNRHRVIGGGCSYKCGAEPVAHFGFGELLPSELTIQWPDRHTVSIVLSGNDVNKALSVTYAGTTVEIHTGSVKFGPTSTSPPFQNVATTVLLYGIACLTLIV